MNERDLLHAQVQGVLEDLIQAQEALDASTVDHLRDRVTIDLEDAFREPRAKLEAIERGLDAGDAVHAAWQDLRRAREQVDPIVQECLAIIHGGLTREHGVAVDVCEVADALLDDLSGRTPVEWGRFTVLAEREFFEDLADIVRVRFPEVGVWSLPFAAHELGHFIAPRLACCDDEIKPLRELIDAEPDPFSARRLFEHVADLFAVYTVGPCYPLACVLLRFDPGHVAEDPLSSHPRDADRFETIMYALDRTAKSGGFADVVTRVRELWRAGRSTLAEGNGAPPDGRPHAAAETVVNHFDDLLPKRAAYSGWLQVLPLAEDLADPRRPLRKPRELEPWDVVNAAWLCRLDRGDRNADVYWARDVGATALRLCRDLLRRDGRLDG